MKRFFRLSNLEVAQAALEEAKEMGLQNPTLESKDGDNIISFESSTAMCDDKEKTKSYVTYDDMEAMYRSFYSEMDYVTKYMREDYAYLDKAFQKHQQGHLPPIMDAGKMTAALKAIGMSDSCEVQKARVYVEY